MAQDAKKPAAADSQTDKEKQAEKKKTKAEMKKEEEMVRGVLSCLPISRAFAAQIRACALL